MPKPLFILAVRPLLLFPCVLAFPSDLLCFVDGILADLFHFIEDSLLVVSLVYSSKREDVLLNLLLLQPGFLQSGGCCRYPVLLQLRWIIADVPEGRDHPVHLQQAAETLVLGDGQRRFLGFSLKIGGLLKLLFQNSITYFLVNQSLI